jgi:hypothetical protein
MGFGDSNRDRGKGKRARALVLYILCRWHLRMRGWLIKSI